MSVYIPASVRGPIYAIYAVLGLVLGGTQVGYSAADAGQPVWLKVALAVFAFVGIGIGYTAASNTPAAPSEHLGEGVENVGDAVREGVEQIGNKAAATYHDGNPGGGDHPRGV